MITQSLAGREVLMVVCELLAQGRVIKGTGHAIFPGPHQVQLSASGKVAVLKCYKSAFTITDIY